MKWVCCYSPLQCPQGTGAGNDRHYWATRLGGYCRQEKSMWSELASLKEYTPGCGGAAAKAKLVLDTFDHFVRLQANLGIRVRADCH